MNVSDLIIFLALCTSLGVALCYLSRKSTEMPPQNDGDHQPLGDHHPLT